MMKKISVFVFLLSFIFSLVVPVTATAATDTTNDDIKYTDVQEFMHSLGYTSFNKSDGSYYIVVSDVPTDAYGQCLQVFKLKPDGDIYAFYLSPEDKVYIGNIEKTLYTYYYLNPDVAAERGDYTRKANAQITKTGSPTYFKSFSFSGTGFTTFRLRDYVPVGNIIYSDFPIYSIDNIVDGQYIILNYDNIFYEGNLITDYLFPNWCSDAGLNVHWSSNEDLSSNIPYSYNDYWHIVRRTSSGNWLLTTIGNSVLQENIGDYKLILSDSGNLQVYSIYGGEDVNGYKINVRQYVYDTDGWKVISYNTYDTRDSSGIVDLGSGSGFDDTRKLAFNNVDIYVGTEYEPSYPKSTEYYEVTTTPPTVEPDNPTSTPSNPSGGSGAEGGSGSSVGGQAKPGGMLDFLITFFTMVWTKLFAVEVPVDGYQISFQAIVIFGVIAGVLIWLGKSSFGKKG